MDGGDLKQCVVERWSDSRDPVHQNLELTIRPRNKIEHRCEAAQSLLTAGYAQASLLNFQTELVTAFWAEESLASELRFPIFVETISASGLLTGSDARDALLEAFVDLFKDHEAALDPDILQDPRYEFRIHLVPNVAPKTEADLAGTYVAARDLTDEQRAAFESLGTTSTVIVHEKERAVANAGLLKPMQAAREAEQQIPFRFGKLRFHHRVEGPHRPLARCFGPA